MITAESLQSLPTKQILAIALAQKVHIPSTARTKGAIIPILMRGLALEPKAQATHAKPVAKPVGEAMSESTVRELLASHIARGLDVCVNSDGTWAIAYRGKEDSGSLTVPAFVLRRLADMVMM